MEHKSLWMSSLSLFALLLIGGLVVWETDRLYLSKKDPRICVAEDAREERDRTAIPIRKPGWLFAHE